MKIARLVGITGIIAMTAVLLFAFIKGDFAVDGKAILNNPWGIVSLVDLYVGFFIFSLWIGLREKSMISAVIWIILLMVLGFFTGALYLVLALYKSKGDVLYLMLGHRKERFVK